MRGQQRWVSVLVVVMLLGICGIARAWEAVVTQIQDGDSFRVRQGRATTTIRLYGIDCPEYQQPGGQQAKSLTAALVKGRRVDIQPMDIDRYDRVVAVVRFDGQVVNAELVRAGWAWVYPRYCTTQPECRQWEVLERDARRSRRGIWRDPAPEAPWQWKAKRQ